MSDVSEPKGYDEKVSEEQRVGQVTTTRVKKQPWWKIGGQDISFASVDPVSATANSSSGSLDDIQGGGENIHGSVYDDTAAAQFYKPIEKYEGLHRFDSDATWTPEEERKLVRTVMSSC
jgi:hypothetical protein